VVHSVARLAHIDLCNRPCNTGVCLWERVGNSRSRIQHFSYSLLATPLGTLSDRSDEVQGPLGTYNLQWLNGTDCSQIREARPKGEPVDFHEGAAREAREMAEAAQKLSDDIVQDMVNQLGITPALANYLLDLEAKVNRLESGGRPSHGGLRP